MNKPIDYNFALIDKHIILKISKEYGLTNVIMVPFMGVGEKIYSVSVLSDTSPKSVILSDQGIFFVKQIPWYARNKALFHDKMEFLYHLELHKIPTPHLIITSKGDKYIEIDENLYYLTTLMQNHGVNYNNSIISSLGKNLAKLHLTSFEYSKHNRGNYHTENIAESCLKLSELIGSDEVKVVKNYLKQISLLEYEELKFLVHGDINPSNIIFSKNSVTGFIDFDNMILDNPVRDFAELIVTFTFLKYYQNTSNIEGVNEKLDENLLLSIINSYKQTAPNIFIKFKHLILPAVKIIFLELFLIAKLRGFYEKNRIFQEPSNLIKQLSQILIETDLSQGIHILDTFEANKNISLLSDSKHIIDIIKNEVISIGLNILKVDYYNFNHGYTFYIILEESHIALHTWPKENKVHLDIFVCNYSVDNTNKAYNIYNFLKKIFKPTLTEKQVIFRK